MSAEDSTILQKLRAENADLHARLEEAEDTLRAIRHGEVDGLIVEGEPGPQVYILQSSDAESNRFRSDILSKVSEAVVALDANNKVIYFNTAAEEQYGIPTSEALGRPLTELYQYLWVRPEDEALSFAEIASTGHWRGENIHIRRDGVRIHVESSVSRLIDRDGMPGGLLAVIRDITGRRQAEAALRSSEERYRTLFNSIDEGFCVVEVLFTPDGEAYDYLFLETNPSFLHQTGLKDVVGKTSRQLMPGQSDEWYGIYGNVALTGEALRFERFAPTLRRHYDLYAMRVGEPGQNLVAIVFNDITQRKEAEEALRRNEALFVEIIRRAPGGVYVVDENLDIVEVNEKGRPVFSEAEPVIGRPLLEALSILWGEDLAESITARFRHTLETGEPFVSPRFTQTREDIGVVQSYEWELQRLALPGGSHGVVCYFSDITEEIRLKDALLAQTTALEEADRRKDEFLAMLAHELRNPLAPLRNAAEILQIDDTKPIDRAAAQRLIGRQIENMSRMIDDLLDVSRITEGKITLQKQTIPLAGILQSAANLIRPACTSQGQQLTVSLPSQPVYVHADPTRLEQVFGNLLGNASKYAGSSCHISISAELEPERNLVLIRVADDGAGIDPELLPRIFDLFVQSSRTLDRAHGGLGIGLTIVQRLVTMHDGFIEAHSDGLGRGTAFTIRLPVRDAPSTDSRATPAYTSSPKGLRMLIVDDNRDSAESMAMLQELSGHLTRIAHTGPEAILAATEFHPEVVLLDIGLPGMDGYEVARQLRALPDLTDAFLVALTGYGTSEDRQRAKDAGFNEHLVKPADLNQLRRWLQDLPR
ncbi:PAS domain S-box protein [Luteolibacter sp. GHJ8]|uniref:histidine kinase n=1 Tax=Luteolibacter rhizosphaerae TaxID=2989719 RepID=A0ABT3FY00_9BACT|nr:PAS domain S-box protein [Luteolibacter rhizosphaerae]MCW1912450.1 PAS domain S-box protein [Luteolibacter rhizosphaerae]